MLKGFSKFPFVYLIVPLILGIAFAHVLHFLWIISSLIVPIFMCYKTNTKLHVFLLLSLSLVMGLLVGKNMLRNQKSNLRELYGKQFCAKVTITETRNWKDDWRLLVSVDQSDITLLSGKSMYLTIPDSSNFVIGEHYFVVGNLAEFRKPSIPEQFDFEEYYHNRGVVAQASLKQSQIKYLGCTQTWNYWIQQIRNHLASNLDLLIKSANERSIIKALVVGNRMDLDPEIKQKYVTAGIFHILAVSGMHVAVIFLFVSFFAKRIQNKALRLVILLGSLVFYACLTGLSQSVIRASVMFAFIAFAQIYQRNTNTLNTLLGSCFLILCVKPEYLYESGFQLSVSAVLGIVLFFKPIEQYYSFKNVAMKWLWSAIAVSIAAQITTTPLVLYYFHQFPTYFLFINVLVVFLVDFVLVFGSMTAVFGTTLGIGTICGYAAEKVCWLINQSSYITAALPYSRITGIYISQMHVAILMAMVLCMYWYFKHQRRLYLYAGFLAISASLYISADRFLQFSNQNYLAYHKVKNRLVIEEVQGKNSILYYDKKLSFREIDLAMNTYWAKNNISVFDTNNFSKPFVIHGNTYIYDSKLPDSQYIIITSDYKGFKLTQNGYLIFDNKHLVSVFCKK